MNATKISAKMVPAALVEGLKANHDAKRSVRVKLVADDYTATADGTYWDGGSKSYHYSYYFAVDGVSPRLEQEAYTEHQKVEAAAGIARVEYCYFCGKTSDPYITVRYSDALKFFGIAAPEGMPVEVAADWMEENAEYQDKKTAKLWHEVAPILRKLTGMVAA